MITELFHHFSQVVPAGVTVSSVAESNDQYTATFTDGSVFRSLTIPIIYDTTERNSKVDSDTFIGVCVNSDIVSETARITAKEFTVAVAELFQ